MDDGLTGAISEVLDRLRQIATEDARLRVRLQQIGQALVHIADSPGAELPPRTIAEPPPAREYHPEPAYPDQNGSHHNGTADHYPGSAARPRGEFCDDIDLEALEARCRLKAEAARFAADRRKIQDRSAGREEIEPRHQELITKAKSLPDCFLWMCHADGPEPSHSASYEDVAGCFDAVADAVALNRAASDSNEVSRATQEKALYLLAESQSALRSAVNRFDGYADPDQTRAFRWLRTKAAETQIYIRRYMRAGDPADPAKWADLSARIEDVGADVMDAGRRTKLRKKLLGRVRHKGSLIAELTDGECRETWRELSLIIDELITLGTTPCDPEMREYLEGVLDRAPDLDGFPFPAGFKLVIRELRQRRRPTPEAGDDWLRGRAAVMIGGPCLGADHAALREAMGLTELFWIETREAPNFSKFEPYVTRDEVAVVLLAREWAEDPDGELAACCRRHGKPLILLDPGFDHSTVAELVARQCAGV